MRGDKHCGAGTESRRTLGATVFFGVTISVFLTLYLIPAIYVLLARKTQSPEHVSREIERLQRDEPESQPESATAR